LKQRQDQLRIKNQKFKNSKFKNRQLATLTATITRPMGSKPKNATVTERHAIIIYSLSPIGQILQVTRIILY
jgi:hypothetical protein